MTVFSGSPNVPGHMALAGTVLHPPPSPQLETCGPASSCCPLPRWALATAALVLLLVEGGLPLCSRGPSQWARLAVRVQPPAVTPGAKHVLAARHEPSYEWWHTQRPWFTVALHQALNGGANPASARAQEPSPVLMARMWLWGSGLMMAAALGMCCRWGRDQRAWALLVCTGVKEVAQEEDLSGLCMFMCCFGWFVAPRPKVASNPNANPHQEPQPSTPANPTHPTTSLSSTTSNWSNSTIHNIIAIKPPRATVTLTTSPYPTPFRPL